MAASGEATPLLPHSGSRPRAAPRDAVLRTPVAAALENASKRAARPAVAARMSDIIQEFEDGSVKNRRQIWIAIFTVANHFLGGIVTFHLLEGWSFIDSAYFTVVVTTTVGYGDMTPVHPLSKLYICYYVSMAVILISTALAFFVSALIEKQEKFVMAAIVGTQESDEQEPSASDPPASGVPVSRFLPEWLADYDQVITTSAFLIVVLAVGVWVFWHFEQMTLVNALYVTMVSASTVGFGDMGPTRAVTKAIMIGWLLVSTATLGKLVSDQTEAFARSKQRDATRRLLSARMDTKALRMMDRDSDGQVSSGEFLGSCLVELGKVSQADIDEIMNRFKQIDRDDSGNISGTEV